MQSMHYQEISKEHRCVNHRHKHFPDATDMHDMHDSTCVARFSITRSRSHERNFHTRYARLLGGRGLVLEARPSREYQTPWMLYRGVERTKGPVTKYVRSEKERWKGRERKKNTERGTLIVSKQDVMYLVRKGPTDITGPRDSRRLNDQEAPWRVSHSIGTQSRRRIDLRNNKFHSLDIWYLYSYISGVYKNNYTSLISNKSLNFKFEWIFFSTI